MALDPIYIRLGDVADFAALGGETALDADDRRLLDGLRAAPQIRYGEVRTLKTRWLRRAYLRFVDDELARATPRAEAFRAYEARQSWWLDAYTTFRAIHAAHEERAWWDWPPALAFADPEAVREAATALSRGAALSGLPPVGRRGAVAGRPVRGQRPRLRRPAFMVSGDSPDVWARKQEFMLDATVGVPPDAFSATGQDWGLPPWRWQAMQATGFQWMRARARRTRGALRRRAHRSPGRALSHLRPSHRRDAAEGVLAARRADAEPARRDAARHLPGQRRRGGGRGSRHRARLRPLVDRPAGRARVQGAALGAQVARAGAAAHRSRGLSRRLSGAVGHPRHRGDDRVVEAAPAPLRASLRAVCGLPPEDDGARAVRAGGARRGAARAAGQRLALRDAVAARRVRLGRPDQHASHRRRRPTGRGARRCLSTPGATHPTGSSGRRPWRRGPAPPTG